VDVDECRGLGLDDLRVGDPGAAPERGRRQPAAGGEGAGEGDGKPSPELGGVPLPEHVAGVVVALSAQRPPSRVSCSPCQARQYSGRPWAHRPVTTKHDTDHCGRDRELV
jgi:hypothetical protein